MQRPIQKLVIAGGGTAGWMTAALLRKVLPKQINIELVESEAIGIIGVGEATIPPILTFNQVLGINEQSFLRETQATIKLAISFENWRVPGESYLHTFGSPGANLGFCGFHHYYLRAKHNGLTQSLWDYDLNALCCDLNKFNKINAQNPIYAMQYAYHFDSSLYGQMLRKQAEKAGVKRIEGVISQVNLDETGFVRSLSLANGGEVHGDLFVDCTGIRALLIQQALGVKFEDWSHWLPANSAIAVPSQRAPITQPFTRSIAREVGWQWRIPLAHRNGNGIVYSDHYMTDAKAQDLLLQNLDTKPLDAPRTIKFKTGRTDKQWHKNVVAIGLSSGFLEPLESTSIHLIQSGVVRLMKMFPNVGIQQSVIDLFNAESKHEFETVRDFIILHYKVNQRTDSDFWQDMQRMPIPDRLATKIEAFKATAAVYNDHNDIFRDASWVQVMMGQGIQPLSYHPSADAQSTEKLMATLQQVLKAKQEPLPQMLPHDEFLRRFAGVQGD